MIVANKIIDKIQSSLARGEVVTSFEFFPAKTEAGVANLIVRAVEMASDLNPTFVTLTWRSAFKDERLWLKIGVALQAQGLDVLLHLTCHLPKADLRRILSNAREAGIRNILALRGDPPIGHERWQPPEGGLRNAIELVRLIREDHGDYFCVAVAGYPEVHTESWNSAALPPSDQVLDLDLRRLKEKVDAGADLIITQFFYDVSSYEDFHRRCTEIGISCPILPGYLPVQNFRSFDKFTKWCKTKVPKEMYDALEDIKDNDAAVKEYGIDCAIRTCRTLLSLARDGKGTRCLHFYTMNLSYSVTKILQGLRLVREGSDRLMPWRGGQARSGEEVRPIFWANRNASYLSRTSAWDEFPNGRWGDSRSPAFGELEDYYISSKRRRVDRYKTWGVPQSEADVCNTFVKYVTGEIESLPWSSTPLALESDILKDSLRIVNANGFLTINSQPSVNGAPSDDPTFGWGGKGGYVFQKEYVEFFCSPDSLHRLLPYLRARPWLTFHAVNYKGDKEYHTSSTSRGSDGDEGDGSVSVSAREKRAIPPSSDDTEQKICANIQEKIPLIVMEGGGKEGEAKGDDDDTEDKEYIGGPGRVNAVTWGIFPGKEVVQPTIVDAETFKVWKDEAFELWQSQWASAIVGAKASNKGKSHAKKGSSQGQGKAKSTATNKTSKKKIKAAGQSEKKERGVSDATKQNTEKEAKRESEERKEREEEAREEERKKKAKEILETIRTTYFLVNVVDNDYISGGSIFDLMKEVITSQMSEDELRKRVIELQAENSRLRSRLMVQESNADLMKQQLQTAKARLRGVQTQMNQLQTLM